MAAPMNMDRMEIGKFVRINSASNSVCEPYPRSGHCCATDGINLFVFGGYNLNYCVENEAQQNVNEMHKVFTEMWCFNLATETWREVRTVGEAPTETASMSMLLAGHTLLFYGGTSYPWGDISNAELITFNLKNKTWSALECTGQRPPGKYGQAMSLRHDHLYIFGGCRQISQEDYLFDSDLHCLDIRNQTWSLLSDMNAQTDTNASSRVMYRHSLAWHGNKMYVIGSSWDEVYSHSPYDKIHVYDLDANSWGIAMTSACFSHGYPQCRQYHSCVQWQNEVYVCGGRNDQTLFGDIWKLLLPTLQWSRVSTDMPVPTFFHTAAITPSKCMYIFGGVTSLRDRQRTNAIYRIWLATPPLFDIALKKLLSLLPERNPETIARLKDLGLSQYIMDRLKHND